MLKDAAWFRALRAIITILIEVTFFWQLRLYQWFSRKSPKDIYSRTLYNAHSFEEWEAAAFQLDEVLGNDLWRQNAASKHYDFRLIYERLQAIIQAREDEDLLGLVNLLRSGLVRNLGNITAFRLYDRAYAGTKLLIEDYITQVTLAIDAVAIQPTAAGRQLDLTSQAKLDFLHDTRQAFGRTALVLQGGAIFGLCHIGVVKSLHLRGLLPRIIVGTGAGALVAALVGVHVEDELVNVLDARTIHLSAHRMEHGSRQDDKVVTGSSQGWFSAMMRRTYRYISKGSLLDIVALERHVSNIIGNMTFEEAYVKTRKVLNISVPNDTGSGMPTLFNYLTTPNVLVRSAAIASSATTTLHPPVPISCKDISGNLQAWAPEWAVNNSPSAQVAASRENPLTRVAELFNVNHYIVSQARPYIAPFLQSKENVSLGALRHASSRRRGILLPLLHVFGLEVQHRLRQLDALGLIPNSIRRFLVDEIIPSAHITLVPDLSLKDYLRLLESPTSARFDEWILRGERSVWPVIGLLKVRCAIENEIDRAYQLVRRRKPMDSVGAGENQLAMEKAQMRGSVEKRKRRRPSNSAAT